jgi:hypothetical protein
LHYHSILSAKTVVRTIDILVDSQHFEDYDQSRNFALEFHLRCIVASLRILTIYGGYYCSDLLTFDLLEKWYNSLSSWAQYSCVHHGRNVSLSENLVENFNNEFLIVYVRDIISSLSSDRDLITQAVARLAVGITLGDSVYKFH